jgi:hypothetical protein
MVILRVAGAVELQNVFILHHLYRGLSLIQLVEPQLLRLLV